MEQQGLKSIVITSSALGEGQSEIAANLAIGIAMTGKRVLLVDANLRSPECHKYFGFSNTQGITEILSGEKTFEQQVCLTQVENLELLSVGENTCGLEELLFIKGMAEIIKVAKVKYDRIILDSPPVGLVTDAAVLSTLCDGVLFVCEIERIPIWKVCKAKEALDKVCGNIIGVVINRISIHKENIFYYH